MDLDKALRRLVRRGVEAPRRRQKIDGLVLYRAQRAMFAFRLPVPLTQVPSVIGALSLMGSPKSLIDRIANTVALSLNPTNPLAFPGIVKILPERVARLEWSQ